MGGNDYPTDDELKAIEDWRNFKDLDGWMELIESCWHWPDWGFIKKKKRYELHTGGWSGNEEIIGAMMRNNIMWVLYWRQSASGGHFVFGRIRELKKGATDEPKGAR